ncbi:GAF domain-containing protein [Paenibacillus mesophilus]|uniref:GAF domain-containing protein n=1 Tax=Paenibacillus mesophilus TaxID=2582849 RepID=UPI00110ED9E2|nr:GAF domain-containing protein [Paenibacillus mesophilus]TMV48098.1 GAF domain-containing protein [Paenibacillus mesophilus]
MNAEMVKRLELLRERTLSDFAAVAATGHDADRMIRWICGSGNANERFMHMKEKAGMGIAGWVVRHGRPLVIRGTEPDAEKRRRDYPIMLAENLLAAAAIPIRSGAAVAGVLLVGSRTARDYTSADLALLEHEGEQGMEAIATGGNDQQV